MFRVVSGEDDEVILIFVLEIFVDVADFDYKEAYTKMIFGR